MGGIFSIEARDMDTKLLSAPESNNTLARCWHDKLPILVAYCFQWLVLCSLQFLVRWPILLQVLHLTVQAVVGVGVMVVVVIIVAVVVIVKSSSVAQSLFWYHGILCIGVCFLLPESIRRFSWSGGLISIFHIKRLVLPRAAESLSATSFLLAAMSLCTSSTNDAKTAKPAYEVSIDLEQIHEDDLEAMDLKWQLSLLSMRAKRYFQRPGKKIFINANNTAAYDKSKIECFNCHKMGHFSRECRAPRNKEGQFRNQDNTRKQGNNEDTSSKVMLAIDGVGFD
ncbi:ribonuclease H-like domain-containing protein [Tanacetum coccineum]